MICHSNCLKLEKCIYSRKLYFDEPGALNRWLADSTEAIPEDPIGRDFTPDVRCVCFVSRRLVQ